MACDQHLMYRHFMAKKMGRPPLPSGESKSKIFNLRVHTSEIEELEITSKESGQSASEVARSRGIFAPIWVRCDKWSVAQLNDKWIRATLALKDGVFEITGQLKVRAKPSGEKFFKIQFVRDMGYGAYRINEFPLTQSDVDRIVEADAKGKVAFKAPMRGVTS